MKKRFVPNKMGKFVESSGFVYNGKVIYKMGTLYKEGKLSSIFKVKGTLCTLACLDGSKSLYLLQRQTKNYSPPTLKYSWKGGGGLGGWPLQTAFFSIGKMKATSKMASHTKAQSIYATAR